MIISNKCKDIDKQRPMLHYSIFMSRQIVTSLHLLSSGLRLNYAFPADALYISFRIPRNNILMYW